MGYDKYKRWVPREQFNWDAPKAELKQQLEDSKLDWSDGGVHAFHSARGMGDAPKAWADMSEDKRLDVLEEYDNWYDGQSDESKAALGSNASWGMDLYRGVSYDQDQVWDAKNMFHELVGLNTDNSPGNQIDYNSYNNSHLFRGITDNIKEATNHQLDGWYPLFQYERSDYENTAQIRAGNDIIREWKNEKGDDFQQHLDTQVKEGALPWRRGYTENWQRNQDNQLARWNPWYTFDEETGQGFHKDIHTGEILETVTFQPPPLPQRVQLTSDSSLQDQEKGIFYTGLENGNERILAGLQPDPSMPTPPPSLNLKINQYVPRDKSRDYMKIENHPYLGEPEPPNSAASKVEVV